MRFGNNAVFRRMSNDEYLSTNEQASMKGVTLKTIILLLSSILTAVLCMVLVQPLDTVSGGIIIFGYLITPIITLILSFVISFNPLAAKILSIPYCILQGISIGTLTGLLTAFLGVEGGLMVGLAFVITLTFFLAATILYSTNIVKVGRKFRNFLFVSLSGIILTSFVVFIVSLFVPAVGSLFYGNTSIALLYSIFCVIIAGLYSFVTLDNAYKLVSMGLAKDVEWYAAFGIVVNVIWLFYEVLRLVMILSSRNR